MSLRMPDLNGQGEYSSDEIKALFIDYIVAIIDYEEAVSDKTAHERIKGVVFSLLALIDGCNALYPGFVLASAPHPEDRNYLKSKGERWFPYNDSTQVESDISGDLHELFLHRLGKKDRIKSSMPTFISVADFVKKNTYTDEQINDWLKQCSIIFGKFVEANKKEFLAGKILSFVYPENLRDGGEGYEMWKIHVHLVATQLENQGWLAQMVDQTIISPTIRVGVPSKMLKSLRK